MRILKSILAGLVAVILSLVLLVCVVILAVTGPAIVTRESAGIGAVSVGVSDSFLVVLLIVAAVVFALAFRWQFRRARHSIGRA